MLKKREIQLAQQLQNGMNKMKNEVVTYILTHVRTTFTGNRQLN